MNLCDIREVKALLARHGFHFSKTMGQNFLTADWIPPEIAAACGADESHGVLEVGPGVGCLTRELCQRAAAVVSVELDRSLLPVLAETMADAENFQLINEDILKLDIPAAADRYFSGLTPLVCANLPYNITTPALRVLVEADRFETITVMVQKEAAQRICAPPGTRESGAISAAVWYYSQPRLLFPVSRGSFLPAPAVDSAVIRLDLHPTPPVAVADEATLFRVIRGAFGQRRKTVLNTLSAALELPKEETRALLEQAGVPATARAEALTLEQFAAIAGGVWSREQNKA